jgi:hypothetical protein
MKQAILVLVLLSLSCSAGPPKAVESPKKTQGIVGYCEETCFLKNMKMEMYDYENNECRCKP